MKNKILYRLKYAISRLALKTLFANRGHTLTRLELTMDSKSDFPLKGVLLSKAEYSKIQKTLINKVRNRELANLGRNLRAIERAARTSGWWRYPSSFRKIRTSIMERDRWNCQACGTKIDLVVHHIDYNKQNSNPNNLITLCHTHNIQANFSRHTWLSHYRNIMIEKYN